VRHGGIREKSRLLPEYVIIFAVKVSELGEFGLIDLLAKMIAGAGINGADPDLIIGIGDDTAAWRCDDSIQLATVDTMVQDVHFTLETITWEELGWKSLAINLSDIAAMGGIPRYALVALALPDSTDVEDITGLYKGMIDISRKYKVAIAGGNISLSPQVSVTVTVIGSSTHKTLLKRSNARPGDKIAVTGYTGSAAAGLEMLTKKLKFKPDVTAYLREAFLRPQPRISEAQVLVKNGITTAIDTSDGLLADLRHICEASEAGAVINTGSLPVHNVVKSSFSKKALELAVGGGEDYELLFTGSPKTVEKVRDEIKYPVTIIGEIKEGPPDISLVDAKGNPVKIDRMGWTHF
jgi:thiamine-monophosphate kinase